MRAARGVKNRCDSDTISGLNLIKVSYSFFVFIVPSLFVLACDIKHIFTFHKCL